MQYSSRTPLALLYLAHYLLKSAAANGDCFFCHHPVEDRAAVIRSHLTLLDWFSNCAMVSSAKILPSFLPLPAAQTIFYWKSSQLFWQLFSPRPGMLSPVDAADGHTLPQRAHSNDLPSIALHLHFSSNYISPLHSLSLSALFSTSYGWLPYVCVSRRGSWGVTHDVLICRSFSRFSHLSRSEWLSPTSQHQTGGAFQGPWRWCCSLGGTQWAGLFLGCRRAMQCSGSWK